MSLKTSLNSSSKNSRNVALLKAILNVVPLETRDALRIAACLGDTKFSLFLLSRVMNLSRSEVARYLSPAEEIGLIFSDKSYEVPFPTPLPSLQANAQVYLMEMDCPWSSESFTPGAEPFPEDWLSRPYKNPNHFDIKYEFLHDKVQEACYEMIPEDQLPATHLNIGRNLKEYSIQSDEVLFEICNHIGAGKHLLRDGERSEMAVLNLNAARKAMTRAAFEHALQYSLSARSLSEDRPRGEDGTFELSVSQILVQSLFSLAKYDEALEEAESIMERTSSELARVVIGVERIRALRSLGRNRDAYELGLSIIKSVGLRVPENVWDVNEIMAVTMSYKSGLDTEETIRVSPILKD